jgi:heme A synthase
MNRRFVRYAAFVLAYNVAVILWGAFVRATGSGAGCGEHWPLCNGEVMPRSPQLATVIEFTHRLTSGLAGLFVIALLVAAFRAFPKGHIVRRCAAWSLALTLTEGLIGAGLVLLGHVAKNTSVWRGVSLTVHLINTLFLLAALACTMWFARSPRSSSTPAVPRLPIIVGGAGLLFIGVSGAIAALGDTLFASESLASGWANDFSSSAHIFLRLRIIHPIAAVLIAAFVIVFATRVLTRSGAGTPVRKLAATLVGLIVIQLLLGVVNLLLLAPVWMQILHLLTADAVWIAFVLLSVESLYPAPAPLRRSDIQTPAHI